MLQVKLYTSSGTLTRIISPKELMWGISWSSQIDWGQGNVSIRLNLPISTQITGDIVKIYSVDQYRPSGWIVYTWWISKIERDIDNAEYITLNCLGLWSLMSQVIASQVNRNGTISSIVGWIIDEMNTKYPYYTKSVQSVSTSLNIAPEYKPLSDLMDSVKYDGYHWRIWWDGVMKWGNIWDTHRLTLGRNISNLSVTTDLEKITNRVYVKYGGWVHMVEDTVSIAQYGPREIYTEKTDLNHSWAWVYGQSLIKWPITSISLSIYWVDYYSIAPCDLVKIDNIDINIDPQQVHKITYRENQATLELGVSDSLGRIFKNLT